MIYSTVLFVIVILPPDVQKAVEKCDGFFRCRDGVVEVICNVIKIVISLGEVGIIKSRLKRANADSLKGRALKQGPQVADRSRASSLWIFYITCPPSASYYTHHTLYNVG